MVLNPLTFGPVQAFYHLFLELVKEGPVFVQHLFQLGPRRQSQEDLSVLEVKVLVDGRVEFIDSFSVINFIYSFRLDGVHNCLDDCSWGLSVDQVVQELVQLEGLFGGFGTVDHGRED